jgi:hypothetical protein
LQPAGLKPAEQSLASSGSSLDVQELAALGPTCVHLSLTEVNVSGTTVRLDFCEVCFRIPVNSHKENFYGRKGGD